MGNYIIEQYCICIREKEMPSLFSMPISAHTSVGLFLKKLSFMKKNTAQYS